MSALFEKMPPGECPNLTEGCTPTAPCYICTGIEES